MTGLQMRFFKGSGPANLPKKRPWIHCLCWSMASPPVGPRAANFRPGGTLKVESVKPAKPAADPGSLHKKMMQLLSSLWVTHAIGTFARLGLADAMEAGADNAEAIAKPRGLVTDRVYRLLRALSTCGIVTESAGGKFALTPLGRMLTSNCAELDAHVGGAAHRIQRRDLEPSRRRARRRHRVRGAEGQAAVQLAARQSEGRRALPAHDGRGAFAGDAGHRRGLRLLAVQAHRRCRRRPRHAAVGDHRRASGRARHAVRSAGGRRRGQARRRRPAAGRDVHRRRRVRIRAGRRRRLSVPPSAARLRRRRLHQDAEKRPPRHEAGFARAGAGEDGADRRHAGAGPLARPARHAADRRPRAHRAGVSRRCSRRPA